MSERARPAVDIPRHPHSPLLPNRRALLRGGMGLCAAVGVGGLGAVLRSGDPAMAQALRFFQIGTGTTGGTYFLIGGILANAISSPPGAPGCSRGGTCGVPGLIVVAQATSGAVENVEAIREGRLESGLVQANIAYNAFRGEGAFEGQKPFTELRAVANLYIETIHLVVRADSGIHTAADLKGRRVALGEKGSGTLVTARALLAAYGLSEQTVAPFYLSPGAASDRLATGEVDAFFIVGGYPLPAVADLANRVPIALLPLDDEYTARLKQRLPFFTEARIGDGAYAGVSATRTLGVGAMWAVHATADANLVHDITRALWHDYTLRLLNAGHPIGASIQPGHALRGLAVPLHPGAERYYRESGLSKETATAMPARVPSGSTPNR